MDTEHIKQVQKIMNEKYGDGIVLDENPASQDTEVDASEDIENKDEATTMDGGKLKHPSNGPKREAEDEDTEEQTTKKIKTDTLTTDPSKLPANITLRAGVNWF